MTKKPTLADLQQQIGELTEALKRERADVTNVRRQHEEQIGGLKDMVKASVVRQLLPVIDNFDRALKHQPVLSKDGPWKHWQQGIEGVVRQFEDTLTQMGVERIKTVGEVFDPILHEAVGMEEGKGEIEVVCEELQSGYKVGEDVIRHAMVKVKLESNKVRS